jgi:hypothetical protein
MVVLRLSELREELLTEVTLARRAIGTSKPGMGLKLFGEIIERVNL